MQCKHNYKVQYSSINSHLNSCTSIVVHFFLEYSNSEINMGPRFITYTDYERLMLMLAQDVQDHIVPPDAMHRLYLILETSSKKEPEEIHVNTITMNSSFLIRSIQTGICKERTLVYPDKSFESEPLEYVNIYDPLGLSVLGYRQNDIIDFYKITRNRKPDDRFLIEKVLFQPEAMQLFNQ